VERLDAVGDPELRRTLLFVRARARPVTSADAAEALGLPRTVARWRLEKLVASGLLVSGSERRSGRSGPGAGRPAKTYAPAAETAAIEFPRRRYERLLGLLVDAVPRRRRKGQLEQVGIDYGRELAAAAGVRRASTMPRALERVCRGLGELGYQAAVDSVTGNSAEIVSTTCPLRPLMTAEPGAQAIDEGMWRGLVEAATGTYGVGIRCRTHDCLDGKGPCRILVSFDHDAGRKANR
jgi:predicted ArsR family transcriptional regulator